MLLKMQGQMYCIEKWKTNQSPFINKDIDDVYNAKSPQRKPRTYSFWTNQNKKFDTALK